METLWDKIRHTLLERAVTVAERAEHLYYVSRVRLDIANDKRSTQMAYAQLGRRVYHLLSKNTDGEVSNDEDVLDLVQRIRDGEEILQERETALANLTDPKTPEPEG